MAQKKKASAARTATANITLPPSQQDSAPVWLVSTAPYDGDSQRDLAVSESQAGSVVEIPSFENGGGTPQERNVPVSGKDDLPEKAYGNEAGTSNAIETALSLVGPGGSAVTSSGKDETVIPTLIRGECEKALVALRRGNSTKALRLIKDTCNRNNTSGIAHRVQGHICMRVASVIEDTNTKQRHSASALSSAGTAAALSPRSVEYAHFYAQLLYEAAKDREGYDKVVRECERALCIDDPIDPARESLHNEQQQELPTAQARVDHVHQELKSLLQKAKNISHFPNSLSTWVKTLENGAGEEKLRFVQMRKFADQDPMEQKVSQPKRPHEVKKVVKTPEERRKEIEVRVTAARLLQQRDSSTSGGIDSPEDIEKPLQVKPERRKSSGPNSRRLSKPLSIDEKKERVRQFWHALSQEKREALLQVQISELKNHFTSSKEAGGLVRGHAASGALLEALEFAQEVKTWRFWACCRCGERFASDIDFHQHISEHIGHFPQHIQNYLDMLAQACGVGYQSEGANRETGEEDIIQDRLLLNVDFTQLLLDERVVKEFPEDSHLFREILEHGVVEEIVGEEGPATHRPPLPLMKGNGETATTHMDLQLSWIFGTAEYEFQPSGWKQFREEQGQRGRDVYCALEKEFHRLHDLCTKKHEIVSSDEALDLVERLCAVEKNRRAQQFDTGNSLETVLKYRSQELLLIPNLSSSQESELHAIADVLRDVRRLPYDGSLGVHVSTSDEGEEEAWRAQDPTYHADSRVEGVIARQREQLSLEANSLDPNIMKAADDLQKLENKLKQLAVLDYRAVALPLVKSFLQSRLEGEAEKDALQKSDAAQESFLAELAKDQKSLGSREVENLKPAHGKSKEKRKTKDQKKLRDLKRAPSNSEPGESASVELDEINDAENWDWVVGDDSKQQHNSEILNRDVLWEEERKLLEALELQRRLEEETKQKHLDEQERKKQIAQQIRQPLEDGKGTSETSPTASRTFDVAILEAIPTVFLQQVPSVQNDYQDPNVVAKSLNGQTILSDHTDDILPPQSLPARNEHSVSDQSSVNFPCAESAREISEQPPAEGICNKILEKVVPVESMSPAGTDVLLAEDGDHLNSLQKRTRGAGSRNRRRRGPRIYAEESLIADQDAESCKISDSVNGPKTLTQQYPLKNNGRMSSINQVKPLLRQNASRRFGVAPANGVHAVQPLLLLPVPPSFEERKKTLRQLQAEQDDEERFQADLEQAMRRSLVASRSVASFSPTTVSSNGIPGDRRAQQLSQTESVGSLTRIVETPLKEVEKIGKGLRNEIGQYNCFLNVVIQSLWHLRGFREELLADSSMQHVHVGNPCVVCALHSIFLGLNTPGHNTSIRDAVSPTALRVALSAYYSDTNFFQEAQMNDASEVLAVIFECLHKAFVPISSSDGDMESSTRGGSWDCQGQHPCMVHALFGLNITEQMNCQSCGLESRHLKYTSFFHNINASSLRTAKVLYPDSSMDELLKRAEMNHQVACDTETGGCGQPNHIHHLLHAAPRVFTTVLGWQNGRESFEDISATVDAMDAALDVGVIYCGLNKGFQHKLVSVICYYGQHYHCFAYNQEHCRWVMFDDSTVKVIGKWRDVTSTCRRGHLQPQVLFYEAVRS